MAELTNECCTPAAQETCCEPVAKPSCCGDSHAGGCGCAAGAEPALTVGAVASGGDIRETVRAKYAEAARLATGGEFPQARALESEAGRDEDFYGCSPADRTGVFGSALYDEASREEVPDTTVMASLGCGVPTTVADLHEGETVLDLGSGGGADVLISARRVGPTGKAIGLDMTDEMLKLARVNAIEAGVENVEWVKGYLEDMPLDDNSVDVVISNCVINLSGDKPKALGLVNASAPPAGCGLSEAGFGSQLRRFRQLSGHVTSLEPTPGKVIAQFGAVIPGDSRSRARFGTTSRSKRVVAAGSSKQRPSSDVARQRKTGSPVAVAVRA